MLQDNFSSSITGRGHGLLRTRLYQYFIQKDKAQALQNSENSPVKKALKPTKHRQETHHKLKQITFDPAFAASPTITKHSQILQFMNAGVSSNTVSYYHTTIDRALRWIVKCTTLGSSKGKTTIQCNVQKPRRGSENYVQWLTFFEPCVVIYICNNAQMHNFFINIISSSACFEQHILTSIRLLIRTHE